MDSLITIDEQKLARAFAFDQNAFSGMQKTDGLSEIFRSAGSSVNLSGMLDLSKIQVQLPELPQMNLEECWETLILQFRRKDFCRWQKA